MNLQRQPIPEEYSVGKLSKIMSDRSRIKPKTVDLIRYLKYLFYY